MFDTLMIRQQKFANILDMVDISNFVKQNIHCLGKCIVLKLDQNSVLSRKVCSDL